MLHRRKKLYKKDNASYESFKGYRAIHRIAGAIKKRSWGWTVLNLAWTAGPLTISSIVIGHYLGFGTGPSRQQMIYFMSYTGIFGLGALGAGLAREIIYQPKIEEEYTSLLENIDWTYGLMLRIRDLNLCSLGRRERKVMAAYYTLQAAGGSLEKVRVAIEHLTGRPDLGFAAEQIVALQEQGMFSVSRGIYSEQKKDWEKVREELSDIAPVTCELMKQWLSGRPPSSRSGRVRDEGFIQRCLDAAEDSDISLMTLTDAYEMVSLTFELLNDRRITSLIARYKGDDVLLAAKMELDQTRRAYRDKLKERNSQIRLILSDIESKTLTSHLPEEAASQKNLVRCLIQELEALDPQDRSSFKESYQEILSLDKRANFLRRRFQASKQAYQRILKQCQRRLSVVLNAKDVRQAGFFIEEKWIQLSDEEKLRLSSAIGEFSDEEVLSLGEEAVCEVAMELALEIDGLIGLSDPEVQSAIEKSHCAQVGYLKLDHTPAGKVGWARQVIQSMHENKMRASHNLFERLALLYQVPVSEKMMRLFEAEFGADREFLEAVAKKQREGTSCSTSPMLELVRLPEWSEITAAFIRDSLN